MSPAPPLPLPLSRAAGLGGGAHPPHLPPPCLSAACSDGFLLSDTIALSSTSFIPRLDLRCLCCLVAVLLLFSVHLLITREIRSSDELLETSGISVHVPTS